MLPFIFDTFSTHRGQYLKYLKISNISDLQKPTNIHLDCPIDSARGYL